jgi:DNA helicase-2/ATP-dependent DNA helicase PcrA
MGYKWNAYAKAYDAPPWRKGPGGPGPQITTIHALGNRLLRRIGLKLIPDGFDDKRKPDESVLQDARKKGRKAVEKALNDAKYPLGPGLYNKRLKGRLWPGKEDIVDAIEYYTQTQPGTPDDVLDPLINQQERQRYGASPGAAVTGVKVDVMALQTDVNRELERLGRISFAGMQTMALHMLDTDPAIAAKVGGMFDHIVVDEAQDVSPLQLALVFRVAQVGSADAPNILLVGDSEGQSIYSFQGGRPELIQAFGRLAERKELTTNFRSVGKIVSAAARLSGRDEAPLEGTPDGPKITTKLFGSVAAEAEGVVQGMIDAHAAGVPWKDMAILYRLKRFSALTQLYLWQSEVPHIVEKGEVFWTSRAPMLAMSYIKFMLKPRLKSFKAIMQTPFRKFGKGYVQAADGVGRTPDGVWPLLDEDLWPAEQWTGLEGLTEDLEDLSSVMDDAAQAIVTIANFSNARTGETLREKAPSGETTDDWTEAWPMLIAAAEAHGGTAAEFLTMVDAAVDAAIEMKTMLKDTPPHLREQRIEKKFGPEGAVTLTTAHSSKGREWPHVYIVGFQGGIFPLARSIKERRGEGEAEERRIAYVAITRAKETLLLSASGDSEQDAHSPYHGPILDIGEIGPAEVSPWLDAYTEWVSAGAPSGQAPFVIRPKEAD